jgi:hypothetical protein
VAAVLLVVAEINRIVLTVSGPLAAGDAGRFCADLATRAGGRGVVVEIRVDSAVRADLLAVEVLARLRLTAARLGCRTVVRGAGRELTGLLHTAGLGFLLAEARAEAGDAGTGAGPGAGSTP